MTSSKIGNGAVIAASIKNGVVTTNKLQNEAINGSKLGKGSVTLAKLGDDVAPLLGTLRTGQTLRGVFYVTGTSAAAGEFASDSVSFQFPLAGNAPTLTVLKKGETNANCAGIGSGSAPSATAGNVCVYLTEETNLDATTPLISENNTRLGFGLAAKSGAGVGKYVAAGQWAVTAP